MDSDELKARSIELAERAYRLKDTANNPVLSEKFDKAAHILSQTSDQDRFYSAGVELERTAIWSEAMRSLAHEINVADQAISNTKPLDEEHTIKILDKWSTQYLAATNSEVKQIGHNINGALEIIKQDRPLRDTKNALDYLISLFEAILSHPSSENIPGSRNSTILTLRSMRDSLVISRELQIDVNELSAKNDQENTEVNRIRLARDSLQEIYTSIAPVTMPN